MKIYNKVLIFLISLNLHVGCVKDDVFNNFNLKMEGITVVYFSKINKVYLLKEDTLFIPLSNRNQKNLAEFIGDEKSLELEFYLGSEKLGVFKLTGNTKYGALQIPYKEEYARILKKGGVKLEKRITSQP